MGILISPRDPLEVPGCTCAELTNSAPSVACSEAISPSCLEGGVELGLVRAVGSSLRGWVVWGYLQSQ